MKRALLIPVSTLVAVAIACGGSADPTPAQPAPVTAAAVDQPVVAALTFDCRADSPDCPEITILGDPPARLPNDALSPTRGYGDPSLRSDPASGRLWLLYSFLGTNVAPTADGPILDQAIGAHLAASDDGGATWTFARAVWPSAQLVNAAAPSENGYAIHSALFSTSRPRRGHGKPARSSLAFSLPTARPPIGAGWAS